MALEQVIYDLEQVKGLSDEELYHRLCENWGIVNGKLAVWGVIKNGIQGKVPTLVTQAKTLQGNREIEYPIDAEFPLSGGAFVSFKSVEELFGLEDGSFVSCELALAPQAERRKHENPFECNVVISSVRRLVELPEYGPRDIV